MHDALVIGIIGGTGDLGSGLARRWAAVGHKVVLGSRSREKAEVIAKELGGCIRGDDNVGAASAADIIVVAVPFSNHGAWPGHPAAWSAWVAEVAINRKTGEIGVTRLVVGQDSGMV